jgi:hypothetical protein
LNADFRDRLALRQQNLRLAQVIDDLFFAQKTASSASLYPSYGKDPAASVL